MVRRICTIVEKAETKQKHFTQKKQKIKKKKKKIQIDIKKPMKIPQNQLRLPIDKLH